MAHPNPPAVTPNQAAIHAVPKTAAVNQLEAAINKKPAHPLPMAGLNRPPLVHPSTEANHRLPNRLRLIHLKRNRVHQHEAPAQKN